MASFSVRRTQIQRTLIHNNYVQRRPADSEHTAVAVRETCVRLPWTHTHTIVRQRHSCHPSVARTPAGATCGVRPLTPHLGGVKLETSDGVGVAQPPPRAHAAPIAAAVAAIADVAAAAADGPTAAPDGGEAATESPIERAAQVVHV